MNVLIVIKIDRVLNISNSKGKDGTVQAETDSKSSTINKRDVVVGATIMVLTQFVMSTIMIMTPVHMEQHGHGLREVGLVKESVSSRNFVYPSSPAFSIIKDANLQPTPHTSPFKIRANIKSFICPLAKYYTARYLLIYCKD